MMAFLLGSLAALASAAVGVGDYPAPKVVTDHTIALVNAADIRWLDDEAVAVSDLTRGIARVSATDGKATVAWLPQWPKPTGPGAAALHLAISPDAIVGADIAFALNWYSRHGSEHGTIFLEYIGDMDVDGDRLLVTGLRRDASGKMGLDGATAWLGSLRGGERSLRPILPYKRLDTISNCSPCEIAAVRFLKDGTFIVVPGAEPGVYLFSREGVLRRVWPNDALGLNVRCDFPPEKGLLLSEKFIAREEWVNTRATVDEVVETPAGPVVIIRTVQDGKTTWAMALLTKDHPDVRRLPFVSSSKWSHLRADTRRDRTAFLIFDRAANQKESVPPRLVLTEW
jgi:hypothetical protein